MSALTGQCPKELAAQTRGRGSTQETEAKWILTWKTGHKKDPIGKLKQDLSAGSERLHAGNKTRVAHYGTDSQRHQNQGEASRGIDGEGDGDPEQTR